MNDDKRPLLYDHIMGGFTNNGCTVSFILHYGQPSAPISQYIKRLSSRQQLSSCLLCSYVFLHARIRDSKFPQTEDSHSSSRGTIRSVTQKHTTGRDVGPNLPLPAYQITVTFSFQDSAMAAAALSSGLKSARLFRPRKTGVRLLPTHTRTSLLRSHRAWPDPFEASERTFCSHLPRLDGEPVGGTLARTVGSTVGMRTRRRVFLPQRAPPASVSVRSASGKRRAGLGWAEPRTCHTGAVRPCLKRSSDFLSVHACAFVLDCAARSASNGASYIHFSTSIHVTMVQTCCTSFTVFSALTGWVGEGAPGRMAAFCAR